MCVVWLRRIEFKKETATPKGRSIASLVSDKLKVAGWTSESTGWDMKVSSGNNTRQADVKMFEKA
jgi:hypothetical protein